VIIFFRKKIGRLLVAWFRSLRQPSTWRDDPDSRMAWLVVFGTLPIAILGLLFQDEIEHAFRDLRLIATTLIVFGILLGIADHVGKKYLDLDHLTVPHGIGYGLAQAFALIPGVSRSGGTITAGRLLGYKREAAAEYAFLLAVPAVFASGLYQLKDIGGKNTPPWGPTIFATVIAFVVGYAIIAWLMRYISKNSFMPFVVYRIALGVLLFVLVAIGTLAPDAGPQL
jgi:undecaprenyl-diphosphatase